MPTAQKEALKKVAKKKGFGAKRSAAFVYGTMKNQAKRRAAY